jgi:hypothetical protein
VANDQKRKGTKGGKKTRPPHGDGYEPVRGPRLRGAEPEAPGGPLIAAAAGHGQDLIGESADEGLRILAALETLESLEPDFCDGLVGEAAVTIIERASPEAFPSDADGTQAKSGGGGRKVPDPETMQRAAYRGPIEEAVVEIFEVPGHAPAAPSPSARRKKRRPVGQRFFKALTDGGAD